MNRAHRSHPGYGRQEEPGLHQAVPGGFSLAGGGKGAGFAIWTDASALAVFKTHPETRLTCADDFASANLGMYSARSSLAGLLH